MTKEPKNVPELEDKYGKTTEFGFDLLDFLQKQEDNKTSFGRDEKFVDKLCFNLISALEDPCLGCDICKKSTTILRCQNCKRLVASGTKLTNLGKSLIDFLVRNVDIVAESINSNTDFIEAFENIAHEQTEKCFKEQIEDLVKKKVAEGFAQHLTRYAAKSMDEMVAVRIRDLETRLAISEDKRRQLERENPRHRRL